MTMLQNAAMQKTLGAVKGSSGRKANAIAAVEDVETLARAAAGKFLARTLCDPPRAEVGVCKSTVFYRTPAPIIVYYFPYITCLLYLLFLIKHVRTSG